MHILIAYRYLGKFLFKQKVYKYFIGDIDDYKTKPVSTILPETSIYVKIMLKLNRCIF